jgi:predicted ATP-grasp superfamily ATP-dependent carboligase
MAESFLPFDELLDSLAARTFERPPALVANAHVTGLGVARALAARDVPVVAIDRSGDGVAPPSTAVAAAGRVRYPLTDLEGFRADLRAVLDAIGRDAVAFGCMDEWVHAFADAAGDVDGLRPSFDPASARAVLDKDALYARCEALGVPYPETHRLWETDVADAVDALGLPLVLKPADKRAFEEAVGTNVVEAGDRETIAETLATARDAGVRVMAQERVETTTGADRSLASYRPPEGDPIGLIGNARVRYPPGYGTACVVESVEDPTLRERAASVLADAGYHGISEAEFVHDADRDEYVLIDVNTRPWKWIGLPVAAGRNLPYAAYADAVPDAAPHGPVEASDRTRWCYLPDYLPLLAETAAEDVLSTEDWAALVSGSFESRPDLTTAVYRPSDPAPAVEAVRTAVSAREYYCAC